MIWSKARFQHSFEILPHVLKEAAPVLLPLSALLWGLEFYVSWLNKARFEDPYGSSMALIVLFGLGGVILQSLIAVVWLLFVAASTDRHRKNGIGPRPLNFVAKHFHQCLIESVRALISTGLYSLFLLLPGLVRWVQLIFTPLIAAFDPSYQLGKKEALKESKRLVGGVFWPLLFFLALQALIPMALEETAKNSTMITRLALYGASWVVTLYFTIYITLTFFARWSFKTEEA